MDFSIFEIPGNNSFKIEKRASIETPYNTDLEDQMESIIAFNVGDGLIALDARSLSGL